MAGKAESIDAYDIKNADVLTPYTSIPSCEVGEFSDGANAQLADLHALSFTETSRSPYDGDESRSQGKFPTSDAPDQRGR